MVSSPATKKNDRAIAYAKTLSHVPWCDDYEQMLSGMLYNCMATELVIARNRARRLAQKLNTHVPSEDDSAEQVSAYRVGIIEELFGKVGKECYVEPNLQVDYGCNITVGDGFYANFNTVILDCAQVTIGDRVLFGTGVSLITATHETSLRSRVEGVEFAEPITILDDCWLGANVTVLPGVTIGRGCTIGAGAVVSRSIPEYSVAMGVPARVVRKVEPLAHEDDNAAQ